MKPRITLLFLLTVFMYFSMFAQQNKGGLLKGTLIDAKSNTPVEFANIALYNEKDSTFVKGSVSGKTGEFILPGLSAGNYYLKITIVGYSRKIVPNITILKDKTETQAGTIKLEQTAVVMKGTEIVGEKPEVEYKLDKKIINVNQNLSASSGTALEVLKNQPSVQTDANGDVQLRGSSNFTVLVNGRPSVMQGSDALRQIPANIIDNIEIITNPSAKYDAEGAAGIINIITKKHNDAYMSGISNVGIGTGEKNNGDFTFNYKEDSYSLSAGLDYRKYTSNLVQDISRETYMGQAAASNYTILDGRFKRNTYNLRLGLDYTITDKSGFSLNGSYGNFEFDRQFNSKIISSSPLINSFAFTGDGGNIDAKYFNTTFFFSQKFVPDVNELTFEATYVNVNQPSNQNTNEYISDAGFEYRNPDPKMRNFTDDSKRNEVRLKANYSHKFGIKNTLEMGLQSNLFYKNINLINKIFDWTKSEWQTTSDMTNKFDFKNNIFSAFTTYSNEMFEFSYQLGLRMEMTDRLLEQKTMDNRFEYNKLHLFPSLHITKNLADRQTVQFSYSRRINRPNERLLNPYPNYSDSYLVSAGNPYLEPEFTNSFELNYSRFFTGYFISVQTYLRSTENSMVQTFSIDNQGRMVTQFGNFASTTNAGAEISGNVSPVAWIRLDPSINLFNNHLNGTVMGVKTETNNFSWNTRLVTTFSFSASSRLQLMVFYFGKQFIPQTEINPFTMYMANFRQEFFDKKLALTISGQNLFNTVKINVNTIGSNFKSGVLVSPEQSIIMLTLTYNFNNFKKPNRGQNNVDINVNDGL